MNKSCGNCAFWFKSKQIKGLCDKYDLGWACSDTPACEGYKRIRDEKKPRQKITVKQTQTKAG